MSTSSDSEDFTSGNNQAHLASMAHHTAVMASLVSTFVNLVGFLSAGAFTAGLTVLSTELGRKLVTGDLWAWTLAYFVSFVAAFSLNLVNVTLITRYSFKSFNDHRAAVYKGQNFLEAKDINNGGFGIALTAFVSALLLLCGFVVSLKLMLNVN